MTNMFFCDGGQGLPAVANVFLGCIKTWPLNMKKTLFIHDNSPASQQALSFAIALTARMASPLLLARTFVPAPAAGRKMIAGNAGGSPAGRSLNGFAPPDPAVAREIDITAMDTGELAQLVNKEEIGLVIGCAAEYPARPGLNLDRLLRLIHCPLLLIPGNWSLKQPERIVYLADLRYCRTDILHYLARLSAACGPELSVAHLSKQGMVHIEENYAHQLFDELVRVHLKQLRPVFHYTRERNLEKASDVLTNGMHQDLLVMTSNRYHFNELVGQVNRGQLPAHIQVPVLIFPG